MLHSLLQVDLQLLHALNAWSGVWAIDHGAKFLTSSNLVKGMLLMTVYACLWFAKPGVDADRRRQTLVNGVIAGLLAIAISRLIADLAPFRLRPMFDPAAHFSIGVDALPGSFENWSSMPSDHAALAMALSFALLRVSRPIAWTLVAYTALVVCLPRVYLGIHYPSDVIVGALIGMLTARLAPRLGMSRVSAALVRIATRAPGLFYAMAFLSAAEIAQMFDNVRLAANIAHKVLATLDFEHRVKAGVILVCLIMIAGASASLIIYFRRGVSRKAIGQARSRTASPAHSGLPELA